MVLRQAGEGGQLYGSVNARDVAQAFVEAGITFDRRQVRLASPLKELGVHKVRVALHPEVLVTVEVNIARSPEEAEMQANPALAAAAAEAEAAELAAEAAETAAEAEADDRLL